MSGLGRGDLQHNVTIGGPRRRVWIDRRQWRGWLVIYWTGGDGTAGMETDSD